MAYQATDILTDIEEARASLNPVHATQTQKIIDHVDDVTRVWIERSPFMVMTTVDSAGRLDASPRGDPAGFVKVLDSHTLAIPDRPGNRRFDTFQNILETGRVGLMFMVPNRNEVVRVNGSAQIVRDANLRADLAFNGREPDLVVLVRVEEAFYHCGKAIIRSRLWDTTNAAPTDGLPTYAEAIHQQGHSGMAFKEIDDAFRYNDTKRLYDD